MLFAALALIVCSLWEVGDTLFLDLVNLQLSTGHGVLLFGLVHALRAAQELLGTVEAKRSEKQA